MSRRWRPAREVGLCAHSLSEDGIWNPGRRPLSPEEAERVFQSPEHCPGLQAGSERLELANISRICRHKRGWGGREILRWRGTPNLRLGCVHSWLRLGRHTGHGAYGTQNSPHNGLARWVFLIPVLQTRKLRLKGKWCGRCHQCLPQCPQPPQRVPVCADGLLHLLTGWLLALECGELTPQRE